MRILIQRVTQAKVSVGGSTVGAIGRGLLVFVGISPKDRNSDAKYLANKLLNIRLWADQETGAKSWSSNVVQNKYDVLLVSQFTLYCVPKGHKPDFHLAMTPEQAEPFYAEFVDRVKKEYKGGKVENGVFGADMQVELTNDGPVTISLDTDDMDFSKENEKEDKMKNKFKKKSDSTPITDATATSPISSPTSIGNISASPTSVVSSPSTSSNTETIPSQNLSSNKSPLSKTVVAASSSSPSFSSLVGNTSLIYLRSLSRLSGCSIYGKAEFENPGGSIKDRPANRMIQDAEARGELVHGEPGWIIEGTAGNTGIGLTLAGAARGYRTIIVMAANNSQEKKDALRSLGAILIEVPFVPFSNPNNYVHVTQRIYQRMKQQYDDSIKNGPAASTTHDDAASTPRPARVFLADQWSNPSNRTCHYETTGPEIWSQTLGKIDAFCCGVGTGGSLNGIGRFLKSKNSKITIGLIDPNGSCLKSYFETGVLTATPGSSISEGIGQGRVCQNLIAEGFRPDVCLHITDQEALPLTYQLLAEEGLSIGSSSAINVTGALRLAQRLGPGHTIVTLLADSGMRYQSKLYNPKFLLEKNLPIPPWLDEQRDVIRSGMTSQVQQWSHEVMVPVDERGQAITNNSSPSLPSQPSDSSPTGSVSIPAPITSSPAYPSPPIDLTTQGIEPNPGPACTTCGYEKAAAAAACGNGFGCSPNQLYCNGCQTLLANCRHSPNDSQRYRSPSRIDRSETDQMSRVDRSRSRSRSRSRERLPRTDSTSSSPTTSTNNDEDTSNAGARADSASQSPTSDAAPVPATATLPSSVSPTADKIDGSDTSIDTLYESIKKAQFAYVKAFRRSTTDADWLKCLTPPVFEIFRLAIRQGIYYKFKRYEDKLMCLVRPPAGARVEFHFNISCGGVRRPFFVDAMWERLRNGLLCAGATGQENYCHVSFTPYCTRRALFQHMCHSSILKQATNNVRSGQELSKGDPSLLSAGQKGLSVLDHILHSFNPEEESKEVAALHHLIGDVVKEQVWVRFEFDHSYDLAFVRSSLSSALNLLLDASSPRWSTLDWFCKVMNGVPLHLPERCFDDPQYQPTQEEIEKLADHAMKTSHLLKKRMEDEPMVIDAAVVRECFERLYNRIDLRRVAEDVYGESIHLRCPSCHAHMALRDPSCDHEPRDSERYNLALNSAATNTTTPQQ